MYHSTEYHREFWNAARGRSVTYSHISEGKNTANGSYRLPSESEKKFVAARKQENLLRQVGCVLGMIRHAISQPVDLGLIQQHELLKRVRITGGRAFNVLDFVYVVHLKSRLIAFTTA